MRHRLPLELFVFAASFLAFAWFHQGGGWNQNSRFAEVRAIVERGELAIDDYLVYRPDGLSGFRRLPVTNAEFVENGTRFRLAWLDMKLHLTPINGAPDEEGVSLAGLDQYAASGDLSFAREHFHPNKPPGLSFVAVPAYFALYHFERLLGLAPDGWWTLTVNGWLTSAFSVGLISALGCALFFREARHVAGGRGGIALLATVMLGFGTIFWAFGTTLFDHNVTAVALLATWALLRRAAPERPSARLLFAAGMCAGLAALTNYVAAVAVVILGVYALSRVRRAAVLWYAAGVLPAFIGSCVYHQICYGSPLAVCNDFQNPLFREMQKEALFGMFALPNPAVALALLISPFRGLFFESPALVLGVWGWWKLRRTLPAEAWVIAAMCGLFFVVNVTFSGWHAGFACGPRYLIPALPFLVLASIPALIRFPRGAAALTAVSIGFNFLFTAVDAQSPLGVGSLARVGDREIWYYNQLTEYAAPLFFTGRAWPILNGLMDESAGIEEQRLAAESVAPDQRRAGLAALRREQTEAIEAGASEPFMLGAIHGPVSVNPIGMYEGEFLRFFDSRSEQAQWNSFNAGEFLFPQSGWSVAPMLAVCGALGAYCLHVTRRRRAPGGLPVSS